MMARGACEPRRGQGIASVALHPGVFPELGVSGFWVTPGLRPQCGWHLRSFPGLQTSGWPGRAIAEFVA